MNNQITTQKLEKYFKITKQAIQEAEKNIKKGPKAELFLDTAKRYFRDAEYFKEKGDIVTAFAALNYAHGWLDAGARIKLFNVKDSKLFSIE